MKYLLIILLAFVACKGNKEDNNFPFRTVRLDSGDDQLVIRPDTTFQQPGRWIADSIAFDSTITIQKGKTMYPFTEGDIVYNINVPNTKYIYFNGKWEKTFVEPLLADSCQLLRDSIASLYDREAMYNVIIESQSQYGKSLRDSIKKLNEELLGVDRLRIEQIYFRQVDTGYHRWYRIKVKDTLN